MLSGTLWSRLLIATVMFLLCMLMLELGMQQERITCSQSDGACTLVKKSLLTQVQRKIALSQVRGHEFVEYRTRGFKHGVTVLFDTPGSELRISDDRYEEALSKYEAMHDFLTGNRQELTLESGRRPWPLALALLFGITVPIVLLTGTRAGSSRGTERSLASLFPRWGMKPALVLTALVVLTAGAVLFTQTMQGTLKLRCTNRCEISGLTCTAGSTTSMSLPAGHYAVRVWAPDQPSGWVTRNIALTAGQTVEHECRR